MVVATAALGLLGLGWGSASASTAPPAPSAELSDPESSSAAGGLTGVPVEPTAEEVEDYLAFVVQDVDAMWVEWFEDNGFDEPDVAVRIIGPGESFQTACSDDTGERPVVTADFDNLFYCSADTGEGPDGTLIEGGIALPVLTLQRMWTGDILGITSSVAGDFAAAVAVAHEFGHSVMDELQAATDSAPPTGKNSELIADCLAGVWTENADDEGILEAGDFEEGAAALTAVGDTEMTSAPHGTSEERVAALTTGFSAGDPEACFDAYWQ